MPGGSISMEAPNRLINRDASLVRAGLSALDAAEQTGTIVQSSSAEELRQSQAYRICFPTLLGLLKTLGIESAEKLQELSFARIARADEGFAKLLREWLKLDIPELTGINVKMLNQALVTGSTQAMEESLAETLGRYRDGKLELQKIGMPDAGILDMRNVEEYALGTIQAIKDTIGVIAMQDIGKRLAKQAA